MQSNLLKREERNMPKWLTEQSNRVGPAPPPIPDTTNGHDSIQTALSNKSKTQLEPDYEVIEFSSNHSYTNTNTNTNLRITPTSSGSKTADGKLKCSLCGFMKPAVNCPECDHQLFCLSCDDMFHKHPKRKLHIRLSFEHSKPPLPPKNQMNQLKMPPVAPPRRHKRGLLTPLLQRKNSQVHNLDGVTITKAALAMPSVQKPTSWATNGQQNIGTLKREPNFLNRPLPSTPKTSNITSQSMNNEELSSRSHTSVFDDIQRAPSFTLEKIKCKANATLDRMQLLQQRYRQQRELLQRQRNEYLIGQQNNRAFDQRSNVSTSPSHFHSGSISSDMNLSSQFDLPDDSHLNFFRHRQMSQSHTQLDPRERSSGQQLPLLSQRQSSLNQRGLSASVFDLNHRTVASRKTATVNNLNCVCHPMLHGQSMSHLNCTSCNPFWGSQTAIPLAHNQCINVKHPLTKMQHCNHSNLSLNMPPGYILHPTSALQMYPSPMFMPYPQPILNGGTGSCRRQASRPISRMTSPAISQKSVTMRRKQRITNYLNNETTDDEDSDDDDCFSVASGLRKTGARRYSSISQLQNTNEDNEHGLKSRRNSTSKSVINGWTGYPSSRRGSDVKLNNDNKSSIRIYSDLDSEGSGTRALVQAKIQEKLKEEEREQKSTENNIVNSKKLPARQVTRQTPAVQKPEINIHTKVQSNETTINENKVNSNEKEPDMEHAKQRTEFLAENKNNEEEELDTNKIDHRDLGPPPCTPEHEWECEFCTFVNAAKTKICTVCCKTPIASAKQTKIDSRLSEKEMTIVTANIQENSDSVDDKAIVGIQKTCEDSMVTTKTNMNMETIGSEEKNIIRIGREIGTSPPPQDISTQTYETLPLNKNELHPESILESRITNNILEATINPSIDEVIHMANFHTVKRSNSISTTLINGYNSYETITNQTPTSITTYPSRSLKNPLSHDQVNRYPEILFQSRIIDLQTENSLSTDFNEMNIVHRRDGSISNLNRLLPISQNSSHLNCPSDKYKLNGVPNHNLEHYQSKKHNQQESDLHKYTPDELNAALKYCGPDIHPLVWLREKWPKLISTVQSLATKYGQERVENNIGTISQMEARDALRLHLGNIWLAVSECIKQRQCKYQEISTKGKFSHEDIVTALTIHQGKMEEALTDLERTQLKPFLMQIWGSPSGVENECNANKKSLTLSTDGSYNTTKNKGIHNCLSVNVADCMQLPVATGAFHFTTDQTSNISRAPSSFSDISHPNLLQTSFDGLDQQTNKLKINSNHFIDNISNYSEDPNFNISANTSINQFVNHNKHLLKDVEILIGNIEQQQIEEQKRLQYKEEENTNRTIHIRNQSNSMKDFHDDEDMISIIKKSPITIHKSNNNSRLVKNKSKSDIKQFLWDHIQDVVPPNLVPQIEMDLVNDNNESKSLSISPLDIDLFNIKLESLSSSSSQLSTLPIIKPPVNHEEFLIEELIKPNMKYANIKEEIPPQYKYASEVMPFRLDFHKCIVLDHRTDHPINLVAKVETIVPFMSSYKNDVNHINNINVFTNNRSFSSSSLELKNLNTDKVKHLENGISKSKPIIHKHANNKSIDNLNVMDTKIPSVQLPSKIPISQYNATNNRKIKKNEIKMDISTTGLSIKNSNETSSLSLDSVKVANDVLESDLSSIEDMSQLRSSTPTSTNEMFLLLQLATNGDQATLVPSTGSSILQSDNGSFNDLKTIEEFALNSDANKQNLSDLVKDTQRLIKQMKDEISSVDLDTSADDEEDEYDSADFTEDYTNEYDDIIEEDDWYDNLEENGKDDNHQELLKHNGNIGHYTNDDTDIYKEKRSAELETQQKVEKNIPNNLVKTSEKSVSKNSIITEILPILSFDDTTPINYNENINDNIPSANPTLIKPNSLENENSNQQNDIISYNNMEDLSESRINNSNTKLINNFTHFDHKSSTNLENNNKSIQSTEIIENALSAEIKSEILPNTDLKNQRIETDFSSTKKIETKFATKLKSLNKTKIPIEISKSISKIPKLSSDKSKNWRQKYNLRSKSMPPAPIGINSVKALRQELLKQVEQQITHIPQLRTPPLLVRKKSITEVITKLTKPRSEKISANSTSGKIWLQGKNQSRIPHKKYHETCFSDEDFESTTTEEDIETLETKNENLQRPVFKVYPSLKEADLPSTEEELVQKFLNENLVRSLAEAQIAATLVLMKFKQDVSIWAAKECSDLNHAINLLQQECELCNGLCALNEIVSMLKCTHKCCKQCAKQYFTVQITERNIFDCNCPFCKLPELQNQTEHEDENLEYFSNLDIFLKNILDSDVHELFQRKLRDLTLSKDPNFKWCIQCASGFFVRPKQKRIICPDCGSITCTHCRKLWKPQHEGITCEKYAEWQQANDPEVQALGVQQYLEQNGIDCPKCKFRYSLTRGGCMHFTCTQCKFEFCYGCARPFTMGAKCNISSYCAKLGLHAHHPRNCLFYLRDKLPIQLQILLKNNGITYEENSLLEGNNNDKIPARCPMPIQKETPAGFVDTKCNNDVPDKYAGLCRIHYVEYLTSCVAKAHIDPLSIFDLTDCVQELRRRGIPLPERGPWDTDEIYKNMCAEVIKKNIPLDAV